MEQMYQCEQMYPLLPKVQIIKLFNIIVSSFKVSYCVYIQVCLRGAICAPIEYSIEMYQCFVFWRAAFKNQVSY